MNKIYHWTRPHLFPSNELQRLCLPLTWNMRPNCKTWLVHRNQKTNTLFYTMFCHFAIFDYPDQSVIYIPFPWKCLYQVTAITVFPVFRLLTDVVSLLTYEFLPLHLADCSMFGNFVITLIIKWILMTLLFIHIKMMQLSDCLHEYFIVRWKSMIPKGYIEVVNWRRAENTMVQRSNNDIQIFTQKNKHRAARIQIKSGRGEGGGMQLKNVHHSQLWNKQKYYILHQLWFSRNYLYNK